MEFFKQVDLDWMGKAKYFFGLSFLLLAAGMASILAHGGVFYGIDFKGGTVVDVRFAGPPPMDTLRNGLAQQGIGNSTIVPVSDLTTSNGNGDGDLRKLYSGLRSGHPRMQRHQQGHRANQACIPWRTPCCR